MGFVSGFIVEYQTTAVDTILTVLLKDKQTGATRVEKIKVKGKAFYMPRDEITYEETNEEFIDPSKFVTFPSSDTDLVRNNLRLLIFNHKKNDPKITKEEAEMIADKIEEVFFEKSTVLQLPMKDLLDATSSILHGYSVPIEFCNPTTEELVKSQRFALVLWWKYYVKRPLVLLGLFEENKYKSYTMDPLTLYYYALNDPFCIPELEIEEMTRLYIRVKKRFPINKLIIRARVLQTIHKMNCEGHSYLKCTPSNAQAKLMKNVILINNKLYHKYYYDLEMFVKDSFNKLLSSGSKFANWVDLSSLPGFTADSGLSDEQKNAVYRSLNSPLSIITGLAGSGKCVHPDTEVYLANFSIVKVHKLKVGDVLLTPSGESTITSICRGEDDMFVVEDINNHFNQLICNSYHILTLYDTELSQIVDIEISKALLRVEKYKLVFFDEELGLYAGNHIKISRHNSNKYFGFELSHDEHFILNNGIVTHNTKTSKVILDFLHSEDTTIQVATTAIAAKVLTENTGHEAKTIHSACSVIHPRVKSVLLDEASMSNTLSLSVLFRSVSKIRRLVLVGDTNQLPPIGAGNFFSALVNSKKVTVCKLTKNFRNLEKSDIVEKSFDILNNKPITNGLGFTVVEGGIDVVKSILKNRKDIAVICAYNKDRLVLNKYLSTINNNYLKNSKAKFKRDDTVMYTINDNINKIVNGDVGKVLISGPNYSVIEFNNKEYLAINKNDKFEPNTIPENLRGLRQISLDKVTQAFAITINKAQGKQWPNCLIYLDDVRNKQFITKSRVYTAITRSMTSCTVVGYNISELSSLVDNQYNSDIPTYF